MRLSPAIEERVLRPSLDAHRSTHSITGYCMPHGVCTWTQTAFIWRSAYPRALTYCHLILFFLPCHVWFSLLPPLLSILPVPRLPSAHSRLSPCSGGILHCEGIRHAGDRRGFIVTLCTEKSGRRWVWKKPLGPIFQNPLPLRKLSLDLRDVVEVYIFCAFWCYLTPRSAYPERTKLLLSVNDRSFFWEVTRPSIIFKKERKREREKR